MWPRFGGADLRRYRRVAAILEQDAERSAGLQRGIGLNRCLDLETMGEQRVEVDLAGCHDGKNRLEIPLCRPAHKGQGVVLAALLILRIVSARPIGARNLEGKLLIIE